MNIDKIIDRISEIETGALSIYIQRLVEENENSSVQRLNLNQWLRIITVLKGRVRYDEVVKHSKAYISAVILLYLYLAEKFDPKYETEAAMFKANMVVRAESISYQEELVLEITEWFMEKIKELSLNHVLSKVQKFSDEVSTNGEITDVSLVKTRELRSLKNQIRVVKIIKDNIDPEKYPSIIEWISIWDQLP